MKDQLVIFETAKLAKVKGFDESCLQAYRVWRENIRKTDPNPLIDIDVEYEPYMGGAYASVQYHNQSKEHTLAPSQSLLQRWLREQRNTHISITCINLNNFKVSYFRGGHYAFSKDGFDKYEEALEVGLQEALKLIKIS